MPEFHDLFDDTMDQVHHDDFQRLARIIWSDFVLLSLAIVGIILIVIGIMVGTDLGVISAIMLGTLPYIYASSMVIKAAQRSAIRKINGRQQWTKIEILLKMADLPSEMFVHDHELETCSDEQLESMLDIRKVSNKDEDDTTHSIERDRFIKLGKKDEYRSNIVQAVRQCRKYNEMCCICFEDYKTGDNLRILPKCHHEYHIDCLDTWVTTFATSKVKLMAGANPTCPLCNEVICQPCEMPQEYLVG
jgi:hypothetical protein